MPSQNTELSNLPAQLMTQLAQVTAQLTLYTEEIESYPPILMIQLAQVTAQLTQMVDHLRADKKFGNIQDSRLTKLENKYEEIMQMLTNHQAQIQEHQMELKECRESVNFVGAEIPYLRSINRDQTNKISELECQVNPFSQDGDAICNSRFIK